MQIKLQIALSRKEIETTGAMIRFLAAKNNTFKVAADPAQVEDLVEFQFDIQTETPGPLAEPKGESDDDTPFVDRASEREGSPETVLVGANLPPRYAKGLAILHAETGRTKKDLIEEALEMYFHANGT